MWVWGRLLASSVPGCHVHVHACMHRLPPPAAQRAACTYGWMARRLLTVGQEARPRPSSREHPVTGQAATKGR